MMKQYKTLLLLVCMAVLLCMLSASTYILVAKHGEMDLHKLTAVLLFNIPFVIVAVLVDYAIMYGIYKRLSSPWRVIMGFLATSFIITLCIGLWIVMSKQVQFKHPMQFSTILFPGILWNILIVMLIELFLYHKELTEQERQMMLMQKEKAEYQFRILKNQLNPHFLFNCLNVAASMAYQDGNKTNRFVKKLSNVYRYLLTTQDSHAVRVEDEMRFVNDYLYLEQIRFDNTLQTNIADYTPYASRFVVPAAIQMLVENAIKHNVNTEQSPLKISITFSTDSITVSNKLQLRPVTSQTLPSNHNKDIGGRGLQNLNQQYILHGKHIDVLLSSDAFTVMLPYL